MTAGRQRYLTHGGLLGLMVAASLVSGCGTSKITADTTCKDYLAQSEEARHDAAVRISSEIAGVSDPGNPMWGLSVDAACGSAPSLTIRDYFTKKD
jgi:hypothetical protein